MVRLGLVAACIALIATSAHASDVRCGSNIESAFQTAAPRAITIDDMLAIRKVDTLSVSPDGSSFAVFVRQSDAAENRYRTSWFVGNVDSGALTCIGDGGDVYPNETPTQEIGGSVSRWSPDGRWIAYTLNRSGEVQLWRSRADGSLQEQLSRNPANVRDFAWSDDGEALYFKVGRTRAERLARQEQREREGYLYDEDFYLFLEVIGPRLPPLIGEPVSDWTVRVADKQERLATKAEQEAFARAQTRDSGGIETLTGHYEDAVVAPVFRGDGRAAWLVRTAPTSRLVQVVASRSANSDAVERCTADECTGLIKRVWWGQDQQKVIFWRNEGINDVVHAFYSWAPRSGVATQVFRGVDDDLRECNWSRSDRIVCVRETPSRPAHIASINLRSGQLQVLADLNPEFKNIRLGKIERFEWATPRFAWNEPGGALAGLYPARAYGYILYPPDFDPSRRYPVIIEPYWAVGFSSLASEQPLHVYAANGFVVLSTSFPAPTDTSARLGARVMKDSYSADLGFPHLSMLAESTFAALDAVEARGFVDERRVGIGGVSHGAFVPLYMLQKYDRLAAVSIASPGWSASEYYGDTKKGRELIRASNGNVGYEDWRVKPTGKGLDFWSQIDAADHAEDVEAPILMNLAASESYAALRLMRHLADLHRPYEAYLFMDETHVKWQPAHLRAILHRNLDWFRFWLQGARSSDPNRAAQYERWEQLREQAKLSAANGADATGRSKSVSEGSSIRATE